MNLERSIKIKIGGIAEDRLRNSLFLVFVREFPNIFPRKVLFDGLLNEVSKIESAIRSQAYEFKKSN